MKVDPEFDYAEAHDPDPWRIMGVQLLAFRTGHKRILQRTKSPFLFKDAGELKVQHLIFALWVCSRSFAEAEKGQFSLVWRIWAWRIARMLERNEELFYSRVEMFFQYMAEANAKPKSMRPTKREGEPEPEITFAPSLMILKRDLMGKHGYAPAEFWELPIRLANYERFAQLEEEGSFSWPEGWERGIA